MVRQLKKIVIQLAVWYVYKDRNIKFSTISMIYVNI